MDPLFCKIINVINAAVNLKFIILYCRGCSKQFMSKNVSVTIFLYLTVMILSCMKVRESLGVLKSLKIKQLVLIQDFLSPV